MTGIMIDDQTMNVNSCNIYSPRKQCPHAIYESRAGNISIMIDVINLYHKVIQKTNIYIKVEVYDVYIYKHEYR